MNMPLTARELMQSDVITVSPKLPLIELDRAFVDKKVSGFPVVEAGQLVGIVTQSDIIRQFYVEQSLAEMMSDYYLQREMIEVPVVTSLQNIAEEIGDRIESLQVSDVMSRKLFTVPIDATVQEIAQVLVKHDIHRTLVTENGKLLGNISALDLVKLLADGTAGC